MRILHTSDWHLGKRLMERDRLSEQRDVLREILDVCEEKEVELILIAGDVFDSFLPSAEAEGLFFHAVKELAGKDRAVVAVSGNHDDGVRLAASASRPRRGGRGKLPHHRKPEGGAGLSQSPALSKRGKAPRREIGGVLWPKGSPLDRRGR